MEGNADAKTCQVGTRLVCLEEQQRGQYGWSRVRECRKRCGQSCGWIGVRKAGGKIWHFSESGSLGGFLQRNDVT